jgi:hypothetical protein
MANVNAPFGLRPVALIGGKPYTGAINAYTWPSASSGALAKGSIVKLTGTGRDVIIAAAGDDNIVGVVMGLRYRNSEGETKITDYIASGATTFGSQDVEVLVADDPDLIFEAQSDATGIAETDVGQFFSVTVGTPDSLMKIAQTVATGVTGTVTTLRLVGLSKRARPGSSPVSNEYGAYAVGQFLLAEHAYRAKLVAA